MTKDFAAKNMKVFREKVKDHKRRKAYWLHKLLDFEIKDNFVNDKREFYRTEYLNSEHWKKLRLQKILTKNCCEKCSNTVSLDVHHLNYKNLYDVELCDLQVLCRACHIKEHHNDEKRKRVKSFFVGENRKEFFPTRGNLVGNRVVIDGLEQIPKDMRIEIEILKKTKRKQENRNKREVKRLKKLFFINKERKLFGMPLLS